MFDISVYLDFVCFHLPLFCFAFASFDCVILLSETYLYAVYFDEPGLKTLKITNRFSGYKYGLLKCDKFKKLSYGDREKLALGKRLFQVSQWRTF